jgi:hypothetical protein
MKVHNPMTTKPSEKLVTILIPNYKTLEITQICLRLIYKIYRF